MYKNIIIEAINNEAKKDRVFNKTYKKELIEKVNNMSEKESKKLVAEAKLEESIGSWLMVGAVHSDECTKKCGASNILYYKRRLCLLKCRLPKYERALAGLKREAAKESKIDPSSTERYNKAILKLSKKIAHMKLMIHRYETSGFIKNAYVNVNRDYTS
jgi:hypothetical protein